MSEFSEKSNPTDPFFGVIKQTESQAPAPVKSARRTTFEPCATDDPFFGSEPAETTPVPMKSATPVMIATAAVDIPPSPPALKKPLTISERATAGIAAKPVPFMGKVETARMANVRPAKKTDVDGRDAMTAIDARLARVVADASIRLGLPDLLTGYVLQCHGVRGFGSNTTWGVGSFQTHAGIPHREAKKVRDALVAEGFTERTGEERGGYAEMKLRSWSELTGTTEDEAAMLDEQAWLPQSFIMGTDADSSALRVLRTDKAGRRDPHLLSTAIDFYRHRDKNFPGILSPSLAHWPRKSRRIGGNGRVAVLAVGGTDGALVTDKANPAIARHKGDATFQRRVDDLAPECVIFRPGHIRPRTR